MWPHQGRSDGEDNIPWPDGHSLLNSPRIPWAFLATHLIVTCCSPKHLRPSLQCSFPIAQPLTYMQLFPPGVRLFTCLFWTCPTFQPVYVSLNGSTAFSCVSHSSQFHMISKLAEVTDGDARPDSKQDQTQHWPLVSTFRPPIGLRAVALSLLYSVSQPVLNPPQPVFSPPYNDVQTYFTMRGMLIYLVKNILI